MIDPWQGTLRYPYNPDVGKYPNKLLNHNSPESLAGVPSLVPRCHPNHKLENEAQSPRASHTGLRGDSVVNPVIKFRGILPVQLNQVTG